MTTPQVTIDPEAIGLEVSWSFGDGTASAVRLPRDKVAAVFDAAGYSVEERLVMEIGEALRRGVRCAPNSRTIQVKELAKPNRDTPQAFGVYQRLPGDESGDQWRCGARVRIEHGQVACLPPEGAASSDACLAVGQGIADLSNSLLSHVQNLDLSFALTDVGNQMLWISRRPLSGGVYFIPSRGPIGEYHASAFASILHGLESLTSGLPRARRFAPQIQEVYAKPFTMTSWAESATEELEAALDSLVADLTGIADDTMREKTRGRRAAECDALIAKAEHYRLFLAGRVDGFSTKLGQVREAFNRGTAEAVDEVRAALGVATERAPAQPAAPVPVVSVPPQPPTFDESNTFNL
jgi:hypothetical protein